MGTKLTVQQCKRVDVIASVWGGTGYGRVLLVCTCDVVPMAYTCIYSIGKRKGFGLFEEVN